MQRDIITRGSKTRRHNNKTQEAKRNIPPVFCWAPEPRLGKKNTFRRCVFPERHDGACSWDDGL